MRRYQKWLSMGLLTLTPHLALADEFDSPAAEDVAVAAPASKPKSTANQELAERVAQALRHAQLNQYEIDIDVRSGVVTLVGAIAKPEQKKSVEKTVKAIPGVRKVINRLEIAPSYSKGSAQQAAASMPRSPVGKSQYIRQTSGKARRGGGGVVQAGGVMQANGTRPSYGGIEPGVIEGGQPAMPVPYGEPSGVVYGGQPPAQLPPAPQPTPVYATNNGATGPYTRPAMPANAYPAPGQAPNYAGVSYPSQQAASAWPYTGPYYPYPQIPLGWRKASLEWDDGYWNMNFRSRTDRWWWYLNPQNW